MINDIKVAVLVLKLWLECPVKFGDGVCPKDEDEYCSYGCFSQSDIIESLELVLGQFDVEKESIFKG